MTCFNCRSFAHFFLSALSHFYLFLLFHFNIFLHFFVTTTVIGSELGEKASDLASQSLHQKSDLVLFGAVAVIAVEIGCRLLFE